MERLKSSRSSCAKIDDFDESLEVGQYFWHQVHKDRNHMQKVVLTDIRKDMISWQEASPDEGKEPHAVSKPKPFFEKFCMKKCAAK